MDEHMREIQREEYDFPVAEGGFDNSYYVVEGILTRIYLHLQFIRGCDLCKTPAELAKSHGCSIAEAEIALSNLAKALSNVHAYLYVEGSTRESIRMIRRGVHKFLATLRARGIKTITAVRPFTDDVEKWMFFLLVALGRDFRNINWVWEGVEYKAVLIETSPVGLAIPLRLKRRHKKFRRIK